MVKYKKGVLCPICKRPKVPLGRNVCWGCTERIKKGADLRTPFISQPGINKVLEDDLDLGKKIYRSVKKNKSADIIDLANKFDCSPSKIISAIENLKPKGIMIDVSDRSVDLSNTLPFEHDPDRIDVKKFKGKTIKFGLTADNHLGSKYYRPDVLNALFDIWEKQGITEVYQCGNMIDGEARFNKHDLIVRPGMESQVEFFIKNWPARKGMKTRFVCGDDHEGWYTRDAGIDIGKAIEYHAKEAGREDLEYLGYMEHDIIFEAKNGSCKMRVMHAGGGSSYALSYTSQKLVESLQGGLKPQIILIGHYHKAEYCYPREVHCVQAGCTMDQSPFMRKKRIQAMIGGWTISFTLDDNGIIHDFIPQWHAFYNKEFYKEWNYLW